MKALLDHLLHPINRDIGDDETVEWCKWLVGGGHSPDDFTKNVQEYNNTVMCGLVWTANFVAFRCQTCRISQCMSLCAECFRHGNHEGHDYNMFKSQAGGACDCGDPSVMRESGFCSRVSNINNINIKLLNLKNIFSSAWTKCQDKETWSPCRADVCG